MKRKKLTPQQRWNRKHKGLLRKDSRKYYHIHRKEVLKRIRIRSARKE